MPRRPVDARAGALVFALLVLATVAAFAWAQRVKRTPLVLDHVTTATVATPGKPCRVRVRFRVTQSDNITVQVVKPGGRGVVTLARNRPVKRYHFFAFYWNGRRRGGGFAPPGRYRVRFELLNEDRVLVAPETFPLRKKVLLGSRRCRHVHQHLKRQAP